MFTVGDVVNKLRERHQPFWTQQKLAEEAAVDKKTVFKLENGGNVEVGTLEKIAKALGVTVGDLYAPLRPMTSGVTLPSDATEDDKQAWEAYWKLDDGDRRVARTLIQTLGARHTTLETSAQGNEHTDHARLSSAEYRRAQ